MNIPLIKRDLLAIAIASAVILFWNLGGGSLTSWDEAFYAQVSREILQTGDWVNLHLMGVGWSDKPPLYMWASAAAFKIFGVNEFSVRLFSAICGVGTILLTYLLALKLYSRKTALASSLILLSTWHFLWASRIGMLDGTLTFFITLSITSLVWGETYKKLLFLSPLAFACAFMTKGSGAMLIPLILGTYIVLSKKFRLLKEPSLWIGVFIGALFVFWWHWQAFSTYGNEFIQGYFKKHMLTRTTQALDGHTGDILTYFGVIPNKGRPWGFLGFAGIVYAMLRLVVKKEKNHLLPIVWFSIVFVLFSLVKTKLHWYIMPVYPPLCIAGAYLFCSLIRKYSTPIVSCLCIASIVYLGAEKDIFNPDYSPQAKNLSANVKQILPEGSQLYMYNLGDPGVQFYLGDILKYLHGRDAVTEVIATPDTYLMTEKEGLPILDKTDYEVLLEEDVFVLIKTN